MTTQLNSGKVFSEVKQILITYNKFSHFVGAVPPHYDLHSHTFVLPTSCLQTRILECTLIITTIDIIYLWTMVAKSISPEKVGDKEFFEFYMHLISRTVAFFMAWQFYFNMLKCVHLVNVVLHLETYFEGKIDTFKIKFATSIFKDYLNETFIYKLGSLNRYFKEKLLLNERRLNYIMKYTYLFAHIQPLFPTIMYIQDPFNVRYWPSRMQYGDNQVWKYFTVFLGGILDIYASIFSMFPVGFIVAMLIVFCAKSDTWLILIKEMGPSERTIRQYKMIEIYNQIGCNCFSASIMPSLYTFGYWFALAMLTTILQRGASLPAVTKLNLFMAFIAFSFCCNRIIKVGGNVVDSSKQTKRVFRKARGKYLRRRLRGCRDVRIYFGDVFYFEKGTFTVFVHAVVNYAITIVLAI